MAKRKLHYQPRVEGGRAPLPSCVLREINREIERRAARYRVSKSWVVAVILADGLGITDQPHYADSDKPNTKPG